MEFNWWQIVSYVIGVIAVIAVFKWAQVKHLIKQLAEALTALSDAIADDNITGQERDRLLREFMEVIEAARKLIGK